jgi:hypothetical protein
MVRGMLREEHAGGAGDERHGGKAPYDLHGGARPANNRCD